MTNNIPNYKKIKINKKKIDINKVVWYIINCHQEMVSKTCLNNLIKKSKKLLTTFKLFDILIFVNRKNG